MRCTTCPPGDSLLLLSACFLHLLHVPLRLSLAALTPPPRSIIVVVSNGSAQFLLFDPRALRLKPSKLPTVTLPFTPCVCALSLHPQHSLLLWCVGVAAHAGCITCLRCSDGRVMSSLQSPCAALAAPASTIAAAALDELGCVAIACSNGALVTAALSTVAGGAEQGIDVAVLLPAAAAPAAVADAQAAGKKRNKQQQQQQQQQDGHICIAAIEPCSVAVAWSGSTTVAPLAAVYDCCFGSCSACIPLHAFDATAALTLHHAAPVLAISDAASSFTCDSRALSRQISLADAIASDCKQAAAGRGAADTVFTHAVERMQDMCLASSSSSSTPAAATATTHDAAGCVTAIDAASLLQAWQQQQLQDCSGAVTCSMVIKRLVSPSTAATFVTAAAAAGNWTDVMTCVRGGGVALSHCPTLVADAAAAGQASIMLECLLRCVDVLETDVACALTFALHSGTPAAFQSLAHYIASAPAASAAAAAPPSTAAATKKSKGKSAEKSSGTGPNSSSTTSGSGGVDAARRSLLHAALRARVSEVSMLPLLRAIPQRALVRLLRYLRSLMMSDAAAEANAVGGGKDCDVLPSLQRAVEWCSMCMDAVGLQVTGAACCAACDSLVCDSTHSWAAGDDAGGAGNMRGVEAGCAGAAAGGCCYGQSSRRCATSACSPRPFHRSSLPPLTRLRK